MTCPTCSQSANSLRSIIHNGQIVEGCANCLDVKPNHGQNDIAKYNRQRDYDDHRQDLVQPLEGADYIHARGIEKAREKGFSDEDIRLLY